MKNCTVSPGLYARQMFLVQHRMCEILLVIYVILLAFWTRCQGTVVMSSDSDHSHKSPSKRTSVFYRLGFTSTPTETSSRGERSHPSDSPNESFNSSHNSSLSHIYNSSPATTPSGRDNKIGWYDTHERHVKLARYSQPLVILIGDSIIAGLSRYPQVWNRFFKPWKALNFGIGGDRTQHVLWRATNIELPVTTNIAVVHCGTNNIDVDRPRDIACGIISIGLKLQELKPDIKVIVTGLLPRDLNWSSRRDKIKMTNKYLKSLCRTRLHFYFMKQDVDWTSDAGQLNETLYYTDCLHLIETGNEKFAKSIANVLYKVIEGREIDYSSDESEIETDISFHLESTHAEKRGKRRSRSPNDSRNSSSGSRKRRRSHSDDSKRKHSSRSSFKWSKGSEVDESTPKKWSSARKWNKVIKKEYHDTYRLENENSSRHPHKERRSSKSPKSSLIALSEEEREKLEARRKRFAGSPVTKDLNNLSEISKAQVIVSSAASSIAKNPSALVVKIQRSIERTRKDLLKQKSRRPSLVRYSNSPSSQNDSQEESVSPRKLSMKNILSSYTSESESE